jgi:two-component system cell cycle sensor histidine kinase/response regulator CckA
MTRKPTYEELQQKVKDLERSNSNRKRSGEGSCHDPEGFQENFRESSGIQVSGINIEWNTKRGTCTFEKLPVAMMWVDTTLAGLMSGVQTMVGTERFSLALQGEGRKSVEADWQVISRFPDFREGFKAIANIAGVAGWGDWAIVSFDEEKKECRFHVRDSWEGRYQKALGVCWGSAMLAGKMAGYCSKLFGTNCWADQTAFIAGGEPYDEFVVRPSPRTIEEQIGGLLASGEATRADMAVALRKLEKEITERRRMEEALRESEEKYRTLVEESFDGIFIQKGPKIIFANQRLHKMLGYPDGELEGQDHWVVYHPDYQPITRERGEARMRGEEVPSQYEVKLQRKHGTFFDGEIRARAILFGNEPGIQVWIRDITERKRAEEAVRESEERFRILVEKSPLGVSLIGRDGRYRYLNPKFVEIFGYGIEEIPTGETWMEKAYPDPELRNEAITTWKHDFQEMKGGEVWHRSYRVACKDGSERDIAFRSAKLETGEALVIYEDTTEQKRLEAQLLQAQKMEAVGTLAGGIAHDFNNSLQGILGYIQILLMDMQKDAPEVSTLRQIERAALRASELTKQLLTFSRRVESKLCPVDLNQEVRQVEKLLRRTIPRMIDIELHLGSDLNIIHADAGQIEQVMMNLGINARDAMPNGGKLTIETENVALDEDYCRTHLEVAPGNYVMLSISDNGTGMDKGTLEHIFEPFYTTKGPGKGTGLGLAMVYGIVKSHGGNIMCYSEPGEGSIFRVYFPVIEENRVIGPDQQEIAEIRGGTETILLVDDEDSIRELGEEMLQRFGYTVFAAADGETALEIYRKKREHIALIILDLIMPGMGGQKCLEEILKIDAAQRVVIASGYSPNGSTRESLNRGAKGYIKKPYEMGPMLAMVREILDQE